MNSYDLTGKTAVVTGGEQGIGRAVLLRLKYSGSRIASWNPNSDVNTDIATETSVNALAIACDIRGWSSVVAAKDATEMAIGTIDILVNSAGIAGPNAAVEDYDLAVWNEIVATNLTCTFHVNKAVIGGMRGRGYGRIVNIASIAGKEGNPNACAYSASKAGVIGFTKSLGKEMGDYDIAVNCVTPAAARTPIFDQMSEGHIAYMLSKIPRRRFLEVEEAANMFAWLVSAENSFTTAAVIDLSGGRATY